MQDLDERKRKILKAIIQTYLETGEPVGSRTISKYTDLNLSSATIRNEMSDLEDLGYIVQPHTSAGRIPSDLGYRLYVDELMKEKEKYSKESMEIIKRSNEELREFKHDLKNYLLPLQEAMETMPQSEMAKVWEKINQKIEDVQTLIQTGNSYVDSMINTKITLARSEKVDVKCTILSKMEGIDDLEFCSVFGNLMDNAIEAERKVIEKKEIIIFVEEKMGYLRLEIQNKIEKSVLNENSSLNTTKKDTSSHGIGHKSIKRTMQKVGGALKYYETGDLFCAEAVFPIK